MGTSFTSTADEWVLPEGLPAGDILPGEIGAAEARFVDVKLPVRSPEPARPLWRRLLTSPITTVAHAWRGSFGNPDFRVEIYAGVLFALLVGGSLWVAWRSANLDDKRYAFEQWQHRRDVMREYAREISRQQVLLQDLAYQALWIQSHGDAKTRGVFSFLRREPEYWDGRGLSEVIRDTRFALQEWAQTPGYTPVCRDALISFRDLTGDGPGRALAGSSDLLPGEIHRVETLLTEIGALRWTGLDQHANYLADMLDDMRQNPVEGLALDAKLERCNVLLNKSTGWMRYLSTYPDRKDAQHTPDQARRYAIESLVKAYDVAISIAHERSLALMQQSLDMQANGVDS